MDITCAEPPEWIKDFLEEYAMEDDETIHNIEAYELNDNETN